MIQEFYNAREEREEPEEPEEQFSDAMAPEETNIDQLHQEFGEKMIRCKETAVEEKEIRATVKGRRQIAIEKIINWRFLHSHKRERITIRLNEYETKKFWSGFIKGDLYDCVIDYHTSFTYDTYFEGRYIQLE